MICRRITLAFRDNGLEKGGYLKRRTNTDKEKSTEWSRELARSQNFSVRKALSYCGKIRS